jgi:hypothetical protein
MTLHEPARDGSPLHGLSGLSREVLVAAAASKLRVRVDVRARASWIPTHYIGRVVGLAMHHSNTSPVVIVLNIGPPNDQRLVTISVNSVKRVSLA